MAVCSWLLQLLSASAARPVLAMDCCRDLIWARAVEGIQELEAACVRAKQVPAWMQQLRRSEGSCDHTVRCNTAGQRHPWLLTQGHVPQSSNALVMGLELAAHPPPSALLQTLHTISTARCGGTQRQHPNANKRTHTCYNCMDPTAWQSSTQVTTLQLDGV